MTTNSYLESQFEYKVSTFCIHYGIDIQNVFVCILLKTTTNTIKCKQINFEYKLYTLYTAVFPCTRYVKNVFRFSDGKGHDLGSAWHRPAIVSLFSILLLFISITLFISVAVVCIQSESIFTTNPTNKLFNVFLMW